MVAASILPLRMRPPSSLPPHRLPRKAIRRLFRDVALTSLLLLILLILVRQHPAARKRRRIATWPSIHPRHIPSQLSNIPRNLYYLPDEPVLYCYIPKNACSRFKPMLRKRAGFVDWADRSLIHGRRNGLQRLMWMDRAAALERLQNENARKFVVVRDPFARLVSAYQNKIATPWPDQQADFWNKHLGKECPGMLGKRVMPSKGPLMSLEEFLTCLLAGDKLEPSNEHWRPQTELCGLDHIKYDRYLHLESLPGDAEELLHFLEWKENASSFQMDRNPVYSRTLSGYFSEEALRLALLYYEIDFEVLKYPRVPTGKIDFYSVFNGTNFQPGFVPPAEYRPGAKEREGGEAANVRR